jgi:N-acetylglucosaminyl-diphospho-decaprenol L-rhamnosyltransferase
MPANPMDLSIIIINWNSRDFLRDCLQSIQQSAPAFHFETIVIDNASFDGSAEMVQREFPVVRYIQSNDNLGFSRGNNAAALKSSGRILLFLNPDTKILGNALTVMKECLDSQKGAGIVGCHILNHDGTVQTTAVQAFPTLLNQTLDADVLHRLFPKSRLWGTAALFSQSRTPSRADAISGACLMIRRDVFEQIGGFSTDYFMYSEDIDISYKAHRAGWNSYYVPTASIIHYNGQSTKKKPSYFAPVMQQESRLIYFNKMRGSFYAFCFRVSRIPIALLRMAMIALLMLLTFDTEKREQLRFSMGKWLAIWRWSLGIQTAAQTQTAPASITISS